jgi:hypothetical protein
MQVKYIADVEEIDYGYNFISTGIMTLTLSSHPLIKLERINYKCSENFIPTGIMTL